VLLNPSSTPNCENNYRGTSGIINGKGNKKLPLNRDLLFNQHSLDWNCPSFIASIRAVSLRASSSLFAKVTPPMPARPVV
jgi:hypothetical protein